MNLDQIINCESFYGICDYNYTGQNYLPSGIVNCDIQHIPEFFDAIRYNGERYVVVSCRSDFGLHLQEQSPVWADLVKAAKFATPQPTYYGIGPRCNTERCNINDKYSIKCYAWTEATFDEIPLNVVKWFLCNNMVNDNRLVQLPFGVNGVDGNLEHARKIIAHPKNATRNKLLYCNWQFYTSERKTLYEYLRNCIFADVTCERDKPFDHYLDMLATHKYCLCPSGNGLDTFRVLESVYMGCIPIVENWYGMRYLDDLGIPCVFVEHMFFGNKMLEQLERLYVTEKWNFECEALTIDFWTNLIRSSL